jgi:serine/threonine protein kinase/Tol biopolymer transport system component
MKPERWDEVDQILQSVLERAPAEREAYLLEVCAGDEQLRREVLTVLASHEQAGSFMASPALQGSDDIFEDEPKLKQGDLIGLYRITKPLGRGGMGEVYLAEHTAQSREVALKILPQHFLDDGQRVQRFRQEARAVLALNHPNVVTVYDIGESEGIHFISTEFVEGQTLRERMASAHLTIEEAVDIALQVASALSYAHEKGVIHRDVKPENIMLRPDGYVKVLDFGIAKLTEGKARSGTNDPNEAPTRVKASTTPGMVMGTVHYMSPEQARGLRVDDRTDTWSLGVILYEMLTGRQPFEGETPSDVISIILQRDPTPLSTLVTNVPPELEHIVSKALDKSKDERYQTAKDFQADLRRFKRRYEHEADIERSTPPGGTMLMPTVASTDGGVGPTSAAGAGSPTTSSAEYVFTEIKRHKRAVLLALVALVALGAAFVTYRYFAGRQAAGHFAAGRKLNIKRLTSSGLVSNTAISPDGRYVAYVVDAGNKQSIRLLQVNTGSDVEIVAPVEPDLLRLNFSRDGDYLYYNHQVANFGTLYQIPALGGMPRQIRYDIDSGAAVSPDGKTLAFVHGDSKTEEHEMLLANADGSNVRRLAAHKPNEAVFWERYTPAWSPDGKMIACGIEYRKENVGHLKLMALRVADGAEQPLSDRDWSWINGVAWLADGNLIVSGAVKSRSPEEYSQLWLVKPGAAPETLTPDLTHYGGVSVTADGAALVTMQELDSYSLWVAPNNDASRAARVLQETAWLNHPSWTPDGRLLYESTAGGSRNIWVMNANGTNKKQLTNGCDCFDPQMSADGRYIIYEFHNADGQSHLWRMDADGSNQKQLTSGINEDWPTFSRDGKWVIYSQRSGDVDDTRAIWKVPLEGGTPVQLGPENQAYDPTVSPRDGSIAYFFFDKQENYKRKISIIPPDGGAAIKTFPYPKEGSSRTNIRFTPDGRSLAFVGQRDGGANIWMIPADGSGEAKPLTDFKTEIIWFSFAWSADGKQLAVTRLAAATDAVLLSEAK